MAVSICLHNGTLLTGFSKMENCAVLIEDGKIADVFSERRFLQKKFDTSVRIFDVEEAYIAPGFIDTHIHGFKGHGTDNCSVEAMVEMSKDLAEYGVTAFNPTLYPAPEEDMTHSIKEIVKAMGKENGAHIMGIHMEGPFISPDKLGVQRPETVCAVDMDLMERLWQASEGHIVNMTVAPELKGMRYLALYGLKRGIIMQAGHTNAEYQNMVEGMQAGILHSTHLFNAMSQLHHRNPGAVGAVLIHPEMSCEIIADEVHVHPDLFKLLARDKPLEKILLVTDSLTPTEQEKGPLIANGEEVVYEGGCFHRAIDGVIAGSSLTMIKGVKNLVKFGFSVSDAVRAASSTPASVMRYTKKGMLIPGYDADIVVFDKQFNILASIIGGTFKKNLL
ncbi:N-acetylglucosamine-6-phosphate deacetylase [Treponema denticola]|uniref:N-acetylglucosamine-6-phosphate deacetylase n=1 Tax=Treponema denticola TaxID=158 RepID=UPI0020A31CC0|nr:N-acetylglucosamine-6-phosphate deacetylase [Treponema denticola]UTD04909.1 N-acetylglucosamine-6-phosphate deacetylase [Treponema denticola]